MDTLEKLMEIAGGTVTADVLVIGGGLVGLATSLDLARRGAKVMCVEADHFGAHQSAQNWGFVRKQGRNLAEVPLMMDAIARWSRLGEDLDAEIHWVQGGNVAIFETAAQEAEYRRWLEATSDLGVDSTVIEPSDLPDVVTGWQRNIRGALFSPSDGHTEPATVVNAYIQACEAAGVALIEGAEVLRLLTRGSTVVGAGTLHQTIIADKTVLAVGSNTRKLLDSIDIDFPQSFVAGTVALTSPVHHVTDTTVWGPGFSFRQRHDGRIVCSVGGGGVVRLNPDTVLQAPKFIGAFKKNWRRFAVRPSFTLVTELPRALRGRSGLRTAGAPVPTARKSETTRALRELQATVQGLNDIRIEHAWAGIIDSTPDGNPVLDANPGPEGLIVAGGFSGHGYGLVPTIGAVMGDLVTTGHSSFDLAPFRLNRFATHDFVAPDAVL